MQAEYCCRKMKILVIGSGGREHALTWKLAKSGPNARVWCAPGNAGISQGAECIPVDVSSSAAIADLAMRLAPDLTVIGPELPLVNGVADEFARRGLKIFGPTRSASRLEGSKIFAKQFMRRQSIPTPAVLGEVDEFTAACKLLPNLNFPIVLKADGLCAGKGVLVAGTVAEATAFLRRAFVHKEFGDGGSRILFEEALSGPELSIIVATDGETVVPMVPSRDHKRLLDGDAGPNTGGMGAFSTDALLSDEMKHNITDAIIKRTIIGLQRESLPYCGFLYFGLMLTAQGAKVLEFNCRSGDPETQAIVMRMNFNLAELLDACASGSLGRIQVADHWNPAASACVVLASRGYPVQAETGKEIHGLNSIENSASIAVFHGATSERSDSYYTSGGRVLSVCASAGTLHDAVSRTYDTVRNISFDGMQFRSDIGRKLSQSAQSRL